MQASDAGAPPARVVLLTGPSGSGKTHLAVRSGLPVLALDDFYGDGRDPSLPSLPDGRIDWDDPATWDHDAAVAALVELCHGDRTTAPVYSFGENRAVGTKVVERRGSPIVVAEGIFAGEAIAELRRLDLLHDALLVRPARWLTFVRRFLRDLREGRKPPGYLLRQGWRKTMLEERVVRCRLDQGARLVSKRAARALLADLARLPRSTGGAVVGPTGIEPATERL